MSVSAGSQIIYLKMSELEEGEFEVWPKPKTQQGMGFWTEHRFVNTLTSNSICVCRK